ncbi:26015_t:CDS:2 [Dentiscutata erythropus]|uniref:26015_t:CDS:1 n=1 Tax=Dentiscutata erythropus TaxID=1348616 RepID=A0A9N9CS59_9GLOM|nr:26015_t:CDS:2 [Dentiscutata erythropus]
MKNKKAQDYINKKYPINGKCNRKSDQENKGKRREEITKLDLTKGQISETIFGKSTLSEPINLFEELECYDNELNSLNINGCSNLKRIDCSNNPSLNEININNCPNFDINQSKTDLICDNKAGKLVRPKQNSSQKVKQERDANVKQERDANVKQERNTNDKQERNANDKQEIDQEISIKKSK